MSSLSQIPTVKRIGGCQVANAQAVIPPLYPDAEA
jgi:hypothetical protein